MPHAASPLAVAGNVAAEQPQDKNEKETEREREREREREQEIRLRNIWSSLCGHVPRTSLEIEKGREGESLPSNLSGYNSPRHNRESESEG